MDDVARALNEAKEVGKQLQENMRVLLNRAPILREPDNREQVVADLHMLIDKYANGEIDIEKLGRCLLGVGQFITASLGNKEAESIPNRRAGGPVTNGWYTVGENGVEGAHDARDSSSDV